MGQQQLILLVLATVIVGLAIVVGIRAFTENAAKANADAMLQDAVRIGNDVQAWIKRPQPLGGPPAGTAMSTATFQQVGYPVDDQPGGCTNTGANDYENINGKYIIAASGAFVTLTGIQCDDDGTTTDQQVVVAVCGTKDTDITGTIMTIAGQGTGATAPTCAAGP